MNYEQTSCENSSISTSSRRDFLKIAGAAVCAAAGAATLGGCSPKLPQSGAEASTALSSEVAWDEETDVLVVGSGMAGLASAVTVATEGEGATCLLLEKGTSPLGGGNSQFSSGYVLWTEDPENFLSYMKELRGGFSATPDDVLEALSLIHI